MLLAKKYFNCRYLVNFENKLKKTWNSASDCTSDFVFEIWRLQGIFRTSPFRKQMTSSCSRFKMAVYTGVIQKVLPVLSTETLLHIWLSTEYYGFQPSSTAVDTEDTRGLMMSKWFV